MSSIRGQHTREHEIRSVSPVRSPRDDAFSPCPPRAQGLLKAVLSFGIGLAEMKTFVRMIKAPKPAATPTGPPSAKTLRKTSRAAARASVSDRQSKGGGASPRLAAGNYQVRGVDSAEVRI
jgi:hypothetical protein